MLGIQERWQDDLFVACPLRDLIPEDHVLRRIDRVLDLAWLRDEVADCYCADNGRPGIDPEAAVRLMLAGLLTGIVHDRKLMREAQVNLAIRWFAGYRLHDKLPHHSSLTRLRQRWGAARFRTIFQRTVSSCVRAGLVKSDVVHVDATLIRADVSWSSLVERHIEALDASDWDSQSDVKRPHKSRAKRVSTTDPDATLATSSRKRRAEPCYKQHTAVDGHRGVVVDVMLTTGDINEGETIAAQVKKTEESTGQAVKVVTADSGYAYGKVYQALEAQSVDAVIPPKNEPAPRGRIPIRRFKYDANNQVVRCPAGRLLRRSTRTKHGWFYRSSCTDCRGCRLRDSCLSPRVDRRTIVISDGYQALLRARRRRHRWSAREEALYAQHRWQAEGAHAEAKCRHGLGRATRRGRDNVAIQVYLTAAAMNLKRLAASFADFPIFVRLRSIAARIRWATRSMADPVFQRA